MGFLRRLFGSKRVTVDASDSGNDGEKRRKKKNNNNKAKRWGFAISFPNDEAPAHETWTQPNAFGEPFDANKHAIAVAAATAAVAEAALAAAHAAAEVVRLTSGGASQISCHRRRVEEIASIRIQSAFRGYLARRALRALKALVKLQSLVRGHIVRKQTTDMLRRMQTLVRVQARVRAGRSHPSESTRPTNKSSHFTQHGHSVSNRNEYQLRGRNSKKEGLSTFRRCGSKSVIDADKSRVGSSWLDSWMEESVQNNHRDVSLKNHRSEDEKTDKILEVDTWKPHYSIGQVNRTLKTSRFGLNLDHNDASFTTMESPSKYSTKHSISSMSSAEATSLSSLKGQNGRDEVVNRPFVQSTSSRPGSSSHSTKGPFTPSRSEFSWGFLAGHPNYMSNTKSSRAKVRSQSAPRQRIEFDKHRATRRVSQEHNWDTWSCSNLQFAQELKYANKVNLAGSHLNRVASDAKLR